MIAAPALQYGRELPTDIDGVAGEKNSPVLISLGHDAMAGPGAHGEHFEWYAFAQRVSEFFGRVQHIQLFLINVADVQAPDLFAVDGGDGAIDLRIDNLILNRRTVSGVFEERRAEQHRHVLALGKNALILNAELAPDVTSATVATN